MSRRRKVLFALAAFVVVMAAGLWYVSGHETPAGQPPLADLTEATLDGFKTAFNAAADEIRVVLLLSPT